MRITQAPLICRNRSIVLRKTWNTTGWNRKPTKNFLMNVRMPADSNSAHDDWLTFKPIDTPVRRIVRSYSGFSKYFLSDQRSITAQSGTCVRLMLMKTWRKRCRNTYRRNLGFGALGLQPIPKPRWDDSFVRRSMKIYFTQFIILQLNFKNT